MRIGATMESSNGRIRRAKRAFAGLALLFVPLLGSAIAPSAALAENWGFAWELGAITATPKADPFVFRLTAARVVSEELSIGPSVYLTPYGDNSMFSGTVNAEFHIAVGDFRLSPFFGLGLAHRRTENDNDTSLMFPVGASLDYPIGESLYALGTFAVNLHDGIRLEGHDDGVSVGITAGIRYAP